MNLMGLLLACSWCPVVQLVFPHWRLPLVTCDRLQLDGGRQFRLVVGLHHRWDMLFVGSARWLGLIQS